MASGVLPNPLSPADDSLVRTREWLRALFHDESRNFLLNADVTYDEQGRIQKTAGSVFRLWSGAHRKHFLTVWGLFDNQSELTRCIQQSAQLLYKAFQKQKFQAVFTCTATSVELLKGVLPLLEKLATVDLQLLELYQYPFGGTASEDHLRLRGKRVLIFTDVIASATLARHLCLLVYRAGGTPTAVACIALTNPQLIALIEPPDFIAPLEVSEHQEQLPLYSLTDIAIPELQSSAFDKDKIRPVEFHNVIPESILRSQIPIAPILTLESLYATSQHQSKRKRSEPLVSCRLFKSGDKYYCVAVNIPPLLQKYEKVIIEKLLKAIPENAALVSTYKRDDLDFFTQVVDKLDRAGRKHPEVILKGDSPDSIYLQWATGKSFSEIRGRPAAVIMCTATSSEELRKVTSVVAYSRPTEIIVICLINRMGGYTTSFVNRIENFLSGILDNTDKASGVPFTFLQVLDLPDYAGADTKRMLQRIRHEFRDYSENGIVAQFDDLISAACSRFEAVDLSSRAAFDLKRQTDPLIEQDLLFAINDAIVNRRFERLAKIPLAERPIETIDYITCIWLIECARFGPNHGAILFASELTKTVRNLRDKRLGIETNRQGCSPDELVYSIEACVREESDIIICLALLHKLHRERGVPSNVEDDIINMYFEVPSSFPSHNHPINLLLQYSSEPLAASLTFFAHLSEPRFREKHKLTKTRELMIQSGQILKSFISSIDCAALRLADGYKSAALSTINLLWEEFGIIRRDNLSEIVEFLCKQLYELRATGRRLAEYKQAIEFLDGEDRVPPNDKISQAKQALLRVSNLMTSIEEFASYDQVVFHLGDAKRYQAPSQLRVDVNDLRNLLTQSLTTFIGSKEQLRILGQINDDLFQATSPISRALRGFITPLKNHIFSVLNDVSNRGAFRPVWQAAIERITMQMASLSSQWILIHGHVLDDVLWNIFVNFEDLLTKRDPNTTDTFFSINIEQEDCATSQFVLLRIAAQGILDDAMRVRLKQLATTFNIPLRHFKATLHFDETASVAVLRLLSANDIAALDHATPDQASED